MRRAHQGALVLALAAASLGDLGCATPAKAVKLVMAGDERELRKRPEGMPASSPHKAPILLLAFDGVGRELLYSMLRAGELPELAALIGGREGGFAHAHLDETLLSTLPSSTMAAWATTMTGVPPSEHGVTGNEFFIREARTFACPAPVTFSSAAPTIEIFTDDYLNRLVAAPSVYERMREKDPDALIWVAMHFLYGGADKLLLAKRTVFATAFEGFLEVQVKKHIEDKESRRLYAELDNAVVGVVLDKLGKGGPVPDVLTVYLSGTDLYAHVADEGPDKARRSYLKEVVEPALAELRKKLQERNALANRWVVVTADHGHTEVVHDDQHALATEENDDPPAVLRRIGFRVRPFSRDVAKDDPFSAVLAYGGAMSYVYLADRSQCPAEKDVCDWSRPPRYEEDALAVAEAFWKNNEDGSIVPAMRGALDLVLTRRPKPYPQVDEPFEVYVGGGRTVPIAAYLAQHPHPTYVAFAERMHDLAVGPKGERAGDVLLIAHNGDRDRPNDRWYFAAPYRSWHGSPSRGDSEIPLIVSHPSAPMGPVRSWVQKLLGARPYQQKVTDLLLGIRDGSLENGRPPTKTQPPK